MSVPRGPFRIHPKDLVISGSEVLGFRLLRISGERDAIPWTSKISSSQDLRSRVVVCSGFQEDEMSVSRVPLAKKSPTREKTRVQH